MKAADLKHLEAQALHRKQRFASTLAEIQEQATLPNLGEEAARLLGNVLPPTSLIDAARRNPSVTLVLATCLAWLVRQANKVPTPHDTLHAKRRKLPRSKSRRTVK
jgi:hypothetical protein